MIKTVESPLFNAFVSVVFLYQCFKRKQKTLTIYLLFISPVYLFAVAVIRRSFTKAFPAWTNFTSSFFSVFSKWQVTVFNCYRWKMFPLFLTYFTAISINYLLYRILWDIAAALMSQHLAIKYLLLWQVASYNVHHCKNMTSFHAFYLQWSFWPL